MTTQPTSLPELWMAGPLAPDLIAQIETRYRVHRGWTIDDPAAYLREHGAAIRGIATSGRFGATRERMAQLPALEAIISYGVGYDPIDIDAAKALGLQVSNTPGVLDDCVADTALALMLAVSRRICEADRFVRSGAWPTTGFGLGQRMSGKRCGIVGLGNIGLQIARRAEGFGMQVAYHNRRARPDAPAHYRYVADLVTLARESDYLVLVVPGGAATRHMIDAEVLAALGQQAYIINVARGTVVDETALVEALQAGRIAGAGLDVFEHEPQVPEALFAMDNVVLLPHIASGTHETRQAMADLFLANLDGWFDERRLVTPVF
ncbi:2-hydroxyacid dehydrogenase [Achromobacter sp. GG226]|uniref:2-hydroxyacid dehydrogenase n=1 Tax=Verticiella alkaliphila TaxID=2779529 RepID=UPI001C0C7802|nr:2-hydroxyacid dehydrogenase [Verticiella sp. GG226]MBU4610882.1 2-hydroxyacid dehydrogenase [Verticiella sp. GG226]